MEAPEGSDRQRLFVAVPLPAELRDFVRRAQEALPPVHGLRLLKPDQWHVTLAFIGEVDAAKAAVARDVVEGLPPGMGGEAFLEGFLMLPSPFTARVVTLNLGDGRGVFGALVRGRHGGTRGRGGHAAGETAVPAAPHDRQAADPRRGPTKV